MSKISIHEAQEKVGVIFGEANSRFSLGTLALLLGRSMGMLHKPYRLGDEERFKVQLPGVFAWVSAVANAVDINLEDVLWEHFPGVCPYCAQKVCNPDLHVGKGRLDVSHFAKETKERPKSFVGMQKMLKRIYPNNTFEDSVGHVVEEATEIQLAVAKFLWARQQPFVPSVSDLVSQLSLELSDILANLIAVANCNNVSLGTLVTEAYKKGCRSCGKKVCSCRPFVHVETVGSRPANTEP